MYARTQINEISQNGSEMKNMTDGNRFDGNGLFSSASTMRCAVAVCVCVPHSPPH